MTRRNARLGALLALLLALAGLSARLDAQGDKPPAIKDVMRKVNSPTGIYFGLARDLKDEPPAWDEIQQQTRLIVQHVDGLARATPPKGDMESWQRLTKAYAEQARALDQAARRMDRAAALAAHARMGNAACMACHKAHRM